MSSILTNNGAMVALQTLKSINSDLGKTQSMISTGKEVASAKDNASVWAISKVMDSDVKGFKGISDSLNLGEATVSVARQASETITDLLTDIKGKIVAAQEENVDRTKIQTDITALTEQIQSVVGAAQFNGLNLIDGTSTDEMSVLSSLDRQSDGTVTSSSIDVSRQNLSVNSPASAQSFGTTDPTDQATAEAIFSASGADGTALGDVTLNTDAAFDFTGGAGDNATTTIADGANDTFTVGSVAAGNSYQIVLDDVAINTADGGTAQGQRTFEYVASAGDGTEDVARNLTSQMNTFFGAATESDNAYSVTQGTGANSNQFTITNGDGTVTNSTIGVGLRVQTGGTAGSDTTSGGLGALSNVDVTSDQGAISALAAIDGLIDQSIDAAAAFGSAQGRIETQSDFVSKLSDSLKSGIGSLVDADMEETSARLQALQVQQQLGVQSLSIANQAPQSIMSLFR